MAIRCHAEQTSDGILISGIGIQADAESLRTFLAELGFKADLLPPTEENDCRVILTGLSLEEFRELIQGANIDLAT